MLIAPLRYPKAIFASATMRLRKRTWVRTRETSEYREDGTAELGARGSGARFVRLTDSWIFRTRRRSPDFSIPSPDPGRRIPSPDQLLKHPRRRHRPPPQLHFADDVLLRHHAPVTAVGAVVAMIAHDEVIAVGNHLRTPVVMASIFSGDVVVVEGYIVHVHAAVDDAHGIAFFGNHPLDE